MGVVILDAAVARLLGEAPSSHVSDPDAIARVAAVLRGRYRRPDADRVDAPRPRAS